MTTKKIILDDSTSQKVQTDELDVAKSANGPIGRAKNAKVTPSERQDRPSGTFGEAKIPKVATWGTPKSQKSTRIGQKWPYGRNGPEQGETGRNGPESGEIGRNRAISIFPKMKLFQ